MDHEKPETNDTWADLLIALAAAWTQPQPVLAQTSKEYGERLMAAARAVSRGPLS